MLREQSVQEEVETEHSSGVNVWTVCGLEMWHSSSGLITTTRYLLQCERRPGNIVTTQLGTCTHNLLGESCMLVHC